MPMFVLKDIDPALWARVRARLQADGYRIRDVALRLFELYADRGLSALERAGDERAKPP